MKYILSESGSVNKELFRGVVSHSSDLIFIVNHQRKISYANTTACRRTGYKRGELTGKKIFILCHQSRRASYISKLSAGLREKGKWEEDVEIVRKDGTTFWGKVSVCNFRDRNKDVAGFVCVIHDLSDHRAAARHFWESENVLQHIIDSMSDALYVVDTTGRVLMCNMAHEKMLGYRREEIVGAVPPYPWISKNEEERMLTALKLLRKEETLNNYSVSWQRKSGSRFFASLAGSSFGGSSKKQKRFVITARDVSDVPYAAEYKRTNERVEMLMTEVKRKAVVLHVLDEINCFVLQNADINKVFKAIVNGVKQLVAHDLAGFYIYNASQQILMPHTLSKQTPFSRRLAKLPLSLGHGIIGSAAVSGKAILVNNAQMDPRSRYPEGMKPRIEHFIAAPMKGRNDLFGVLVISRNSDPQFIEEEAHLIELFANAATVAVENARLFLQQSPKRFSAKASDSMKELKKSVIVG